MIDRKRRRRKDVKINEGEGESVDAKRKDRREGVDAKRKDRRGFRLDRLVKKAEVLKHRKWVFMSIAVIVVAIAAIIFKVM